MSSARTLHSSSTSTSSRLISDIMKRLLSLYLAIVFFSSVCVFAQTDQQRVNDALATIWARQLESRFKDSPEARRAYFDGLARALRLDSSNPRELGLKDGLSLRDSFLKMRELGLPLDENTLINAMKAFLLEGKSPSLSNAEAQLVLESFVADKNGQKTLDAAKEAAWVAEKAKLPDAKTLECGVVIVTLTEGGGATPSDADTARVRYSGRLSDGKVFDSTGDETIDIPLNRVIKGFAEGLKNMKTGGKYSIFIPPHLAYGETGAGGGTIPGNAALEFEITLVDVIIGKK